MYRRKEGTYYAAIGFKGKRYNLGTFDTYEEAVIVREYAEDVLHNSFVEQYRLYAENAGDAREKEPPEHDPIPESAKKAIERILNRQRSLYRRRE